MLEVGRHVQRETMAGDPPRDADTDRRQLFVPDPHPGQAFDSAGLDPVVCGGADENRFQIAYVAVNVAAERIQVDDRITNDLAGAVVGDVAAAPRLVDGDA